MSPSSVVWANVGAGRDGADAPPRSSWTDAGIAVPFVPYDPDWLPDDVALPAYRELYEQSLITFADCIDAATIPVEQITADVLVTAGGNDQVWPSLDFAQRIVDRRTACQLTTRLATNDGAGHRVQLPGEQLGVARGTRMARGGTSEDDKALGRVIWRELEDLLDLRRSGGHD